MLCALTHIPRNTVDARRGRSGKVRPVAAKVPGVVSAVTAATGVLHLIVGDKPVNLLKPFWLAELKERARASHFLRDADDPIETANYISQCVLPNSPGYSFGTYLKSPNKNRKMNMKTDTQVQQDVLAELKWEPSINAAAIGVEVKDGIVTLAGHVDSYAEKWDAERFAQRVTGVKALAVEIDVTLPGSSKRNDADIARAAKNVMEWMTYSPKDAVKIKVEGGWVTLSGEVEWEYQRRAAKNGVGQLMGVTGVSDQITLTPQASPEIVKSGIEASLHRRAKADGKNIKVEVLGNQVTLTGTVHSWDERKLAEQSAWAAPGVRSVVDNMVVRY
jgi:osmotically-inducible protein OsmY